MAGIFCFINHVKPDPTDLVLNGVVTPAVIVLGLFGNMYCLLRIIAKVQLSKRLNTYLRALALWDMAVLLCALGDYGLLGFVQLLSDTVYHHRVFAHLARYFHGLSVTAMTGSIWITVAIAVARYWAVAKPFQNLSARTINARIICLCVSVGAILYCSPCHAEIGLRSCFCNVTQETTTQIWPKLFASKTYRTIYRTICYSIFVSVGPFLSIVFLSLRTVSTVRATQNMASRLHRGRRRVSLLFTLLLIKFLLTNFPSTAVMLSTAIFGQEILLAPGAKHMANIANLCALLHNATNFLIYINPCLSKEPKMPVKYCERTTLLERSPTIRTSSYQLAQLPPCECKRLFEIFIIVTDGNKIIFQGFLARVAEEKKIAVLQKDPGMTVAVADNIYRFLYSLISQMWRDQGCRWTIRVRNLVRMHRSKGFEISAVDLDLFKVFLVNEGRRCKHKLSTQDLGLWNRFLSSVIAEMKLAIDYV